MGQESPIRRALLSVSERKGIVKFAQELSNRGIELLSTGSTAVLLSSVGVPVINISDYTGFPEMMDGRIKTLHPKIHGGILGRRGEDDKLMSEYNINPIDMVIVNFYPFNNSIQKNNFTLQDVIESIDIGGPAMVRAAAKNYKDVVIVVDHNDYNDVIAEMDTNINFLTLESKLHYATKAFEYTASYDSTIANYFGKIVPDYFNKSKNPSGHFPRTLNLNFIKKHNVCYGENKHQRAAFYIEEKSINYSTIATSKQIQGKELSYNNIVDIDTALQCVKEFHEPTCVIVKHANPCAVAIGNTIFHAYQRAYLADPTSAFGGIIAFNRELDECTVQSIITQQFVEVIIAPSIKKSVLKITKSKENLRLLICDYLNNSNQITSLDFKCVYGGLLVQDRDLAMITSKQLNIVTNRQPTDQELEDALFSWKVVKFVRSNAIVFAHDNMTIGIGAGQMSRIYAAKIANLKAKDQHLNIKGSTMASDAFLPFRDSIDTAFSIGVSCVIQPGGSIRDSEIIDAANEHNISMMFTGIRHFRH
ncbi:bifunctional phosphoribosylaminoimidazolecarboxamide formyltransferase/IMP cyclohydrolase [Pantoea sp. Mhis]|uniref:bifunctional phosphoribosylaminoimidazolecarboxamide formyltransferase/IMP cyclohydrolase n=1 Tax=Pantoea sp. Mhis TaxID=2576759 RepID=UPI001357BCCC|nr:bifunctional phosphoribosylaminoimidazolecarboxamide formyltransferase/IMP cyclohydrolase [Pantoea sp. Mhis]MXP56523.1 bifunctional phosphoribosylaminoimidazolecarboxamide formyltransferase/IMP cyclohydrolase [Pantoea sp. Mhis]